MKNKIAVVIITYNCHEIFVRQLQQVAKHCKDKFEFVIVDNSTRVATVEAIAYHCSKQPYPIKYFRTRASSQNGSASHAFAANFIYNKIGESYTHYLFLDHDCFPIKDFSIAQILEFKEMAGLGQDKGVVYYWPGCVMFKQNKYIDFSPNNELGLDTGGNLHFAMNMVGKDNLIFFNEEHVQNESFDKSFYNFYALINDGMFMHFINASNWNGSRHNEERLNSLINIMDNYEKNAG